MYRTRRKVWRDSFLKKRGGTPSIKFGLATLNICFFHFTNVERNSTTFLTTPFFARASNSGPRLSLSLSGGGGGRTCLLTPPPPLPPPRWRMRYFWRKKSACATSRRFRSFVYCGVVVPNFRVMRKCKNNNAMTMRVGG